MPTLREHKNTGWRVKMIVFGILTAIICFYALPHSDNEAMTFVLGSGLLMGIVAVIGGFMGLQDHKF